MRIRCNWFWDRWFFGFAWNADMPQHFSIAIMFGPFGVFLEWDWFTYE